MAKAHLLQVNDELSPLEAEELTKILGRDARRSSRCGTGASRAVPLEQFQKLQPWNRCGRCDLAAGSPGVEVKSSGQVTLVTRSFLADTAPEALDLRSLGCGDNSCVFGPPGGMATNGGCKCVPRGHVHPDEARAVRDKVKALLAALRSVMAERDRAESHAKRAETLAHDLQAQVLALRSLFVNFRWDGPAWIKPEEHLAMEEANRLAGGKPLDS